MSTITSTSTGYFPLRAENSTDDMRRVSCQLIFSLAKRKRKASLRARIKEVVSRLIHCG